MDWLKPAMAFMALSSALLASTFFYVWHSFIRRRYVLLWSLAWLVSIPHIAFSWLLLDAATSELAWVGSGICLILNALLMVGGCHDFVHRRVPVRALALVAAPYLLWTLLAPVFTDKFLDIMLPYSILLGGSYLWTSRRFLHLRRERQAQGARLAAILLTIAGVHEFDYPLLGNLPGAAPIGYFLAASLAIAIALCLLIMILEESRSEAERERARVQAILDHLPVGVLVTAPDGRILLTNHVARALAGGTGIATLAAFEQAVFGPVEGSPHALPMSDSQASGETVPPREFSLTGSSGTPHTYLVNAGPVKDERGGRLGTVGVFQDIDQLKRMQNEVVRSERLQGLGTLAAGVAHDFNNALTMILGHAELAAESSRDPVVRQQIGIISRVAADSAAIVRRIQDVARTRTHREQVVFDLAMVAREVVDISRPRWRDEAHAGGVSYDVRTQLAHDVAIAGQPAEMREALLNLVFNALDAMPQGGVLTLSVERRADEAVLVVSDSGVGMSAETRERIFDPFFTTKGTRGTGLGLAVVFSIIQRHDGHIAVESQPGQGTQFILRFPIRAPVVQPVERPPSRAGHTRLRVLVVDDEDLVRGLIGAMLRQVGHDVTTAADGTEALRELAEHEFDVVLTDLGMPAMNGWEVAAAVASIRPCARVVLVTGWGETVTAEQACEGGITRVLGKPFTRTQLLSCIDEVVAQPV